MYHFFQKDVDNFEIEHKTCQFLVKRCSTPLILHLAENPMKIGWLVPKIQAVEGFAKQYIENKELFFPFNWLYPKISVCEFRLILLDHITIT